MRLARLLHRAPAAAASASAQVVEGYEVVKAVEACGSRSGETAFDVMIADCGQLAPGEGRGVRGSSELAGLDAMAASASGSRQQQRGS